MVKKSAGKIFGLGPETAMKVVMFSGLLMVVGGYFDSWWHVNVGRESFWIPPHLVIYSGLVTVLAGLAFVLVIEKPGIFKWIAIAGFFMMFSAAPIDDWWHLTHPPEVGLALMSPPHMYFAVGGALVGFSVMNMLANMSIRTPGLRKYLFVYILAGYLMSMQAIGLMDPGDPTALGYVGSALFFSVPAGFYIFAKKAFSDRHVIGMGSVEGCAKTLLEGSLLYFPALFASSVFVSRFGPLRDTYAHHFLFGAMVGAVTSTYLIFFVDSLGAAVVLQRAIIGVVCAGLAGLLANFAARELFRNYRWIKSG